MNQRIKNLILRLKSPKGVFRDIYYKNIWESESRSGPGSELDQTKELLDQLPILFEQLDIKSIIDAPCGDFNWMRFLQMDEIDYLGCDIVPELVAANNHKYSKSGVRFLELDIISDSLPEADLILVRDCFVHFSYKNIEKALINIKKSGIKYIATTTFLNCNKNYNIPTGEWRSINLEKDPFKFPKPLVLINENCSENGGQFSDKCLGVWSVNSLP